MSQQKFSIRPGGRVRFELSAEEPTDNAVSIERRRSLAPTDDDPTQYVFRDSPTVTVHDLGTRLVAGSPYSYRELDLFYPIHYDVSGVGPTEFGGPLLLLTEEQWAAVDAELLAGDPFSYTNVGGIRAPNALALNRDAPLGQVPLDFYVGSDYFGTPYPLNTEGENEFWRWDEREASSAEWSPAVTEHGLAPSAGRYVRKKSQKYSSFYLYDFLRFWDWPFGMPEANSWVYLTDSPDPASSRADPPLKFPLRVFGAPLLYRPAEESSCRAQVQGEVGSTTPGIADMFGWAIVQEIGINFTARLPQIPVPGEPDAEAWLAMFTAASLRTLRRVATWKTASGSGGPAYDVTSEWALVEGRRPKSQAEVRDEAVALATAQADEPRGETFLTESPGSLQWVTQLAPPASHLVGAVEVAGKVYYVWRE